MHQIQKEIEFKYSKKNISDVVRAEVNEKHKTIQFMVQAIENYRNKSYSYASKQVRALKLRGFSEDIAVELAVCILEIEEVSPIQAIATQLAAFLKYPELLDGIKTAAEIIAVCEGSGLYELLHSNNPNNTTETLAIKANYEVSTSVKEFIKQTKYLPPMIVKPVEWKDNHSGGYLEGSGSVILGNNSHDKPQALDALNILQAIEWELNTEMLEFVEESKKELDTYEKVKNFNRMRDTSEEVYRDLLEQGNKFYFVWKYDFRGRSYSQGYHCNLQSNSYRKAILNFKHKELLTEFIEE